MDWLRGRLKNQHSTGAESPSAVADTVGYQCPTCGASGSNPCVTPSGKVRDTPHAKRGS